MQHMQARWQGVGLDVQDARLDMIAAHKVLQDVQEITF